MKKVVIDTNVILSGILFGGTPALLLDAVQHHTFTLCTSQQHHDEVLNKLTNTFQVKNDVIRDVATILSHGVFYTPTITVDFPQDPKDAYLLELAEACRADYLITGDKKHLVPVKIWKKTRIITPAQTKDILLTSDI